MTGTNNDIDSGVSTEIGEAEEINAPVAKLVKASPFQSDIAGSKPVGSTSDNWCKMKSHDFNIKRFDTVIAGKPHSRLSVLQ